MGKKLRMAFGVFMLLVVVAGGYGYYFVTCPCSEREREVRSDVSERVEVIYDEYGVPHIFAATERDLFFSMGYVVAADRLFQMDLTRRAAKGEIAEIFGEDYADYDYFIRSMGLRKSSEEKAALMTGESKLISEAFCEGVNHYMETHEGRLPIEFRLAGYEPAPWTLVDIYSVALYMAYDLSRDYDSELVRYRLLNKVGPDLTSGLFPPYPDGFDIQIPEYERAPNFSLYDDYAVRSLVGWGGSAHGSNNWVVSGKKTQSGYPLLANDPHLGLDEPSIWYEIHLSGAGFNVYGTTIPGVPAVIIGHNEDIAWGETNVGADVQDLYIEKINPADPHQYWYVDSWRDMDVEETVIDVKGKEPVIREILYTIHGPIVSLKDGEALSLQWTAHLPSTELDAFMEVARASNLEEFREGMRDFTVPAQNFVYADRTGTIAYFCNGRIPIRKKGLGMFPVDGSSGEYGWEGFIPFDELPHIANPPKGYIVTSNVKVAPDSYPYYLFYNYAPPYRFQRIVSMLSSKDTLGTDDMKAIQNDVYSLQASIVVPKILPLLDTSDPHIKKFSDEMRQWDFNATSESTGTSAFFAFMLSVLEETYEDDLGDLYAEYLKQDDFASQVFTRIMEEDTVFFDRKDTLGKETKRDIVNAAAKKGMAFLEEKCGADYRWKNLHTITFNHPLGSVKPLNYLYDIGPIESPGSSDTINNGAYGFNNPFDHTSGPSLRMIVDFSDVGHALLVTTTGQGGSPFCRNYRNMTPLWQSGRYHTMWFSQGDVRAHAVRTLILVPG